MVEALFCAWALFSAHVHHEIKEGFAFHADASNIGLNCISRILSLVRNYELFSVLSMKKIPTSEEVEHETSKTEYISFRRKHHSFEHLRCDIAWRTALNSDFFLVVASTSEA